MLTNVDRREEEKIFHADVRRLMRKYIQISAEKNQRRLARKKFISRRCSQIENADKN